jgi:hypothetical protein
VEFFVSLLQMVRNDIKQDSLNQYTYTYTHYCPKCRISSPAVLRFQNNFLLLWISLRTVCLREYLDLREMKTQEAEENCIMKSSIVCTLCDILLELSSWRGLDEQNMLCAWGSEKRAQNFSWEGEREETTRQT